MIMVNSRFHFPFPTLPVHQLLSSLTFPGCITGALQENVMKTSQLVPLKALVNSMESTFLMYNLSV